VRVPKERSTPRETIGNHQEDYAGKPIADPGHLGDEMMNVFFVA
jgi:hypothetical protein